jgi:hypothetical protein
MAMNTVNVMIAGHEVAVPQGGYFDRYRMNPDLDEVARDPAVSSVEFFRKRPKCEAVARFGPTWTPNFYYRTSSIQLLLLAPLARLQTELPRPLRVLRILPGFGLVALSVYRYDVCDNDPYNEAAIAIVVRRPARENSQVLELIQSLRQRTNYAYVLALPVTTEVAWIRGVEGYGLPKWVTKIDLEIGDSIEARVFNTDGGSDLVIRAPRPRSWAAAQSPRVSTIKLLSTIDGLWHETLTESSSISRAQSILPQGVHISRGAGPLNALLEKLEVSKIIRLEVIQEGQIALHLPEPRQGM